MDRQPSHVPAPHRHGCVAGLLMACGSGSIDALDALITAVYPLLRARAGSDDDVFAAFLEIWRHAPEYTGSGRALTWILDVAGPSLGPVDTGS